MSARIERFEDFVAWQKARLLTAAIYRATAIGAFAADFGLRDQLRRAAVSVMSNIAEGFERGTPSEFHRYLVIAKGSCAEVRSQLYVALDAGHLTPDAFTQLYAQANEVGKILGALRASVQQRRDSV